jgi:hypothetical protein
MFGKGFTLFKLLGFEVQMDISRLIIQSVSCRTCDLHVDGFRFDLVTIFTRDKDGRIQPTSPTKRLAMETIFHAGLVISRRHDMSMWVIIACPIINHTENSGCYLAISPLSSSFRCS